MKSLSTKGRGTLEMISAMTIMGTVGVFVVESEQNVYHVVFFRCLFGAFFLSLYCYLRGLFKHTSLTPHTLMLVTLSGGFIAFNWVLLAAAYSKTSISTATVIYHIHPFFFLIIGAIVFQEKINPQKIFWIALAFFGVVLVSKLNTQSLSMSSDQLIGSLYVLSAALLWALTAIIAKKLHALKPQLVIFIQTSVGALVLYPFTALKIMSNATPLHWTHLLILGSLHTCLALILAYSAFAKLSTTSVSVLSFIFPAVAILADFIVYNKTLTPYQTLGVFLILFSGFAVNQNINFLRRT